MLAQKFLKQTRKNDREQNHECFLYFEHEDFETRAAQQT